MKIPLRAKPIPWTLVLVFVFFVTGILAGGYFYYQFQRNSIVLEKQNELAAIADLKIGEIMQWRHERQVDAATMRGSSAFARQVLDFLQTKSQKRELLQYLETVCEFGGYSSATLLDSKGVIRLSTGSFGDSIGQVGRDLVREVMRERNIVISDLFISEVTKGATLDLVVPIDHVDIDHSMVTGVLLFRIDPYKVLYPLIQTWPTPSKSSETLLIRREGDKVVYLNELRHQKHEALTLRLPITDEHLPAAKAAKGFEGVVEGSDYRGEPVLAAIRAVPQTSWQMISKVDQDEIYAPLRQQAWLVAVVMSVLLFAAASVIGLWWRHQRAVFYRGLYELETIRTEGEQRYRSLFENMLEGFAYCRMVYENDTPIDFIYLEVNRAFESLTTLKEAEGRLVSEVIPGIRESNPELLKTFGRVALTGQPERFETYLPALGIWLSIAGYSSEKGYFVAVFDNITRRKRAAEALAKEQFLMNVLMDNIPDHIYFKDTGSRFTRLNKALANQFGLNDPAEAIGKTDFDFFTEEHARPAYEDEQKIIRTRKPLVSLEEMETWPNGGETWVSTNKLPLCDSKGQVIGTFGVSRDITERKRAELELQKLSQRNSAILASVPDIIVEVDNNKVYGWANRAGYEFFGEDVIGKEAQFYFEGEQETYREVQPLFGGREDVIYLESWQRRRDGEKRLLAWWCRVLKDERGNVTGALSTARDITELKQAEEAIRANEEKFRSLFEHSPLGISMTAIDGSLHVNKAFCDILGYSEEELRSRTWQEISHPEDIEGTERMLESLLSGSTSHVRFQKRYVHKHGSIVWAEVSTALHRDVKGNPEFFITAVNDITSRKQAERDLKESEERYRSLIEVSPDAIFINQGNHITYLNGAAVRLFGAEKAEQIIGMSPLQIFHPDYHDIVKERVKSMLEKRLVAPLIEEKIIRLDGNIVDVEVAASPFVFRGEHAIQVVMRDITERKRAEEKMDEIMADLQRSNNELEQFAYVASHDLQEPLRMVSSFTQLLERRYQNKLDTEAHEFIKYAVDGASRMQILINDLLQYSRVGTRGKPFEKVDCSSVLGQVRVNLRTALEESHAILTNDDLPVVMGDEPQLERLFQNLIDNALKFRTDKPPLVHVSAHSEKEVWVFSIKDNGIGISPEYHGRIFQIFQRLHEREKYEGTGIGLAIAKRIVERHGGKIWLESEPGEGTTFYFTLSKGGNAHGKA